LYAADDLKVRAALDAAAAESALHYQMLRCRVCGLEFCEPFKAPPATWYRLAYRALDLHSEDRWEYGEVLRQIPKDSQVFELGCGSGNFLLRCQEHGVAASGIDFSEDGIAKCLARGLKATHTSVYEIATATNTDRVSQIVSFQFLEHLDRPMILFQCAAAKARPGAHLWVSVPSDNRPAPQFGFKEFLNEPPHHLTEWTPEAFRQMGMRVGWRLIELIYEPAKIRTSLWWITVHLPIYLRLQEAGWMESRLTHRSFCLVALPVTLLQWLRWRRKLSGYAMLAHFIFEGQLIAQPPVPR
jgi:SAM-dependent methyltransferase